MSQAMRTPIEADPSAQIARFYADLQRQIHRAQAQAEMRANAAPSDGERYDLCLAVQSLKDASQHVSNAQIEAMDND